MPHAVPLGMQPGTRGDRGVRRVVSTFTGPGFFRLALALIVFIDHATRLNLGTSAVLIFFMLSGYWICTMWTVRYSKARIPYLTYLVSRLWRLLPVFILCAVITWTLLALDGLVPPQVNWVHEAVSNLLIIGYSSLAFQPDGPAWSLDIEVQFYIIAPLLISMFMRHRVRRLVGVAIFSVSACFLIGSATVAPYLVFFAVGIACAMSMSKTSLPIACGSLVLSLTLIAGCIAGPFRHILLGGAHPSALYHEFNGAAQVLFALTMAPWAIYTTGQTGSHSDGMLGDLSYIVYLLHVPVMRAVNTGIGSYRHRGELICEALLIVLLGAVLIWGIFDRPMNRLRSKWVVGRIASGCDEHSTANRRYISAAKG